MSWEGMMKFMRHRVITLVMDGLYYEITLEEYKDNKWQKVGHTRMVHENTLGWDIAEMLRQAA